MESINRRTAFVAATVWAACLAPGCVQREVVVAPVPAVATVPAVVAPLPENPAVVVLKDAPPPPKFEEMTARPSSEHVWIPGYWAWHSGQLQWFAGHWEVPPHPGARWVTSRWERRGDGFVFRQGFWQ